jgi:transcriptional regulator with XRE-family HTH domain
MPNRQRTSEELAFNATVGRNIKFLRNTRNLNQTKVANALSVSFQQIQKYEKGANGLSAIRLKQLASFFKVGTDVLIDPNLITMHKGFNGKLDWVDDVNKKETTLTQVGSDGSVIDVTFDVAKYQDFEDEYPMPLSQLEHDPKMRATYDAILEDE